MSHSQYSRLLGISHKWNGNSLQETTSKFKDDFTAWNSENHQLKIDKEAIKDNDSIFHFMLELVKAGQDVIAFIDENYLNSDACLTELYGILLNRQPDKFSRFYPATLKGFHLSEFLKDEKNKKKLKQSLRVVCPNSWIG